MDGNANRWDYTPGNPLVDLEVAKAIIERSGLGRGPNPEDIAKELRENAIAFEKTNGESPNMIILPATPKKRTHRDRWMKEVKRLG